jgi:hypothetical protein
VQYFKKRFASVVKALDDLSQSSNKKEAAEARGCLLQFQSFDMVFFLNVFEFALGITNGFRFLFKRFHLISELASDCWIVCPKHCKSKAHR